jgi:hypothetical protein
MESLRVALEKPRDYTIKTSDLTVGDEIAVEKRVPKPTKDSPTSWWLMGRVVKVTGEINLMLTTAEAIAAVNFAAVVFRKPWADEMVRNVLKQAHQKKRLKLKLPKGLAGEMGRLQKRNGDKPLIEWR